MDFVHGWLGFQLREYSECLFEFLLCPFQVSFVFALCMRQPHVVKCNGNIPWVVERSSDLERLLEFCQCLSPFHLPGVRQSKRKAACEYTIRHAKRLKQSH